MRKLYLILVFLMLGCGHHLMAQAFDVGTKVASLGVGIGSSLGSFNHSSQIPAISIQYEQGKWELGEEGVVSLGGYLGYKSFKYRYEISGSPYSQSWNYTIIGIRSAYHYVGLDVEDVDVYGGVMLAYNWLTYKHNGPSGGPSSSGSFGNTVGLTLYIGGRYYFQPDLAVFGEIGYGVSYLNLGIAYKF